MYRYTNSPSKIKQFIALIHNFSTLIWHSFNVISGNNNFKFSCSRKNKMAEKNVRNSHIFGYCRQRDYGSSHVSVESGPNDVLRPIDCLSIRYSCKK